MNSNTDRIQNNFSYHAPKGTQIGRYERVRNAGKELALILDAECPDSTEKEHALHYLDMTVMNANAAIARNE
jgi:hypothetical protein